MNVGCCSDFLLSSESKWDKAMSENIVYFNWYWYKSYTISSRGLFSHKSCFPCFHNIGAHFGRGWGGTGQTNRLARDGFESKAEESGINPGDSGKHWKFLSINVTL